MGKEFEIREYPVPDPEPGAALVRVTLSNVCGSDLHVWRGELESIVEASLTRRPMVPST